MRDYINIGSSPYDEQCAQVGTPDYHEKVARECRAYKRQLIRQFGEPPEGAALAIKSFPHDFGTYHEVVCYYDTEIEGSKEYAFKLESDGPSNWDEQARTELNTPPKCSL